MTKRKGFSLYDFSPLLGLAGIFLLYVTLEVGTPLKRVKKIYNNFKSITNITLFKPPRKNPIIPTNTIEDTITQQNTLPTTSISQIYTPSK
jgi:hypothetical protein